MENHLREYKATQLSEVREIKWRKFIAERKWVWREF